MIAQLSRYGAFYAAVAVIGFRLGWWAAHYVGDRMDNFNPRIGQGKYGW